MKTASLVASVSRRAGGLYDSVRRLHQSLAGGHGIEVSVLALRDEFTDADLPSWAPLPVQVFPVVGPTGFGFAPALKAALEGREDDIVHTHGLWMYPSVAAQGWHRRTRRPYVVSPHGMLDPWAVRNSAWKKRLALRLYERAHLEQAGCLRALCESEAESIRALGLRNPIGVIPNGMDLPKAPSAQPPVWADRMEAGRKVLLYLGRIHPKKGLANLLDAWAQTRRAGARTGGDWSLVIAGWDQGGHEQELQRRCAALGIASSVLFTGPLFGEAKAAAYDHCDAFVLPSLSEGLPMVVLEAWAHAKPVLMTPGCNLPEGFTEGAALRIEPSVEGGVRGLMELFGMNDRERTAAGRKGRDLVVRRFNWSAIAADMRSIYEWLTGSGARPACVRGT